MNSIGTHDRNRSYSRWPRRNNFEQRLLRLGVPVDHPAAKPVAAGPAGYLHAVRLDWPDGGHVFVGPEAFRAGALRRLGRLHQKWRRSPVRPRLSLVTMREVDFAGHLNRWPDCSSRECLAGAERGAV